MCRWNLGKLAEALSPLVPLERLTDILVNHTGQEFDVLDRDTDRDTFLSAIEAKEYGLVDEVVEIHRLKSKDD